MAKLKNEKAVDLKTLKGSGNSTLLAPRLSGLKSSSGDEILVSGILPQRNSEEFGNFLSTVYPGAVQTTSLPLFPKNEGPTQPIIQEQAATTEDVPQDGIAKVKMALANISKAPKPNDNATKLAKLARANELLNQNESNTLAYQFPDMTNWQNTINRMKSVFKPMRKEALQDFNPFLFSDYTKMQRR